MPHIVPPPVALVAGHGPPPHHVFELVQALQHENEQLRAQNVSLKRKLNFKQVALVSTRRQYRRLSSNVSKHKTKTASAAASHIPETSKSGRYLTVHGGFSLALKRNISNMGSANLSIWLGKATSGKTVRRWEDMLSLKAQNLCWAMVP
jgi:hypothetical protein